MSRLHRITSDPAVCHGRPTVRGLRYPVESLLELLAAGMTVEDVLDDHPDLEREDILAALEFGAPTSIIVHGIGGTAADADRSRRCCPCRTGASRWVTGSRVRR